MTKTRSSARISSAIASRSASRTVILTTGPSLGGGGGATGVGAGVRGAGGGVTTGSGARAAGATASPSPEMVAITVPTLTPSVPSETRISEIVPSSTASNSIVALSVSISARISPDLTVSPALTSHLASVPSSIVGESAGILSSIAINRTPRAHRYKVRSLPVRENFLQNPPLRSQSAGFPCRSLSSHPRLRPRRQGRA